MKKLLTFIAAITIAFSGMAQNGKAKGHYKNKSENYNKDRSRDRDDRNTYGNNNNRNWSGNNNNQNNNQGGYSNNLPNPVRAAFYRDFPNAGNVSWTKTNGYWTASFPNGMYRVTATYSANGQRINSGSTATNGRRTQTQSSDGSVWNKILSRQ